MNYVALENILAQIKNIKANGLDINDLERILMRMPPDIRRSRGEFSVIYDYSEKGFELFTGLSKEFPDIKSFQMWAFDLADLYKDNPRQHLDFARITGNPAYPLRVSSQDGREVYIQRIMQYLPSGAMKTLYESPKLNGEKKSFCEAKFSEQLLLIQQEHESSYKELPVLTNEEAERLDIDRTAIREVALEEAKEYLISAAESLGYTEYEILDSSFPYRDGIDLVAYASKEHLPENEIFTFNLDFEPYLEKHGSKTVEPQRVELASQNI